MQSDPLLITHGSNNGDGEVTMVIVLLFMMVLALICLTVIMMMILRILFPMQKSCNDSKESSPPQQVSC